jgi:biotin-(acetyl-CoA carboxylase) ligase
VDFIDLLFIGGLTNLAVDELRSPAGIGLNTRTPPPEARERLQREAQEAQEARKRQAQERETRRLEANRLETERWAEQEHAAAAQREQWLALMNQRYPGVRWR